LSWDVFVVPCCCVLNDDDVVGGQTPICAPESVSSPMMHHGDLEEKQPPNLIKIDQIESSMQAPCPVIRMSLNKLLSLYPAGVVYRGVAYRRVP
jgi:hypothetical protein